MERKTGHFENSNTTGENVSAFVPDPLPPNPPLEIDENIRTLLGEAETALGQLRVAVQMVPSKEFFTYAFVRKEAILSSQIENIQATLTDLFDYEAEVFEKENYDDIKEVCNYIEALQYAKKQLESPKGLPISLRLFREVHKKLMKGGRGSRKTPGEFRTTQNWIGGTRPGNALYVPPPPSHLSSCLDDFEKYLHGKDEQHPLLKIAFSHVQFESIHPFLDGNGRLGRLFIALQLDDNGYAPALSMYPSLHFKRHRNMYYDSLSEVRRTGDWERWSRFFLEAIIVSAREATRLSGDLFKLHSNLREKLHAVKNINVVALKLFEKLPVVPVLTLNQTCRVLKVTKPTATKALNLLLKAKILKEITAARRNRVYTYYRYIEHLAKEE